MVSQLEQYHNDFAQHAHNKRAVSVARFFKTGKGQYGEGDQFLGLTVPMVRTVVKKYSELDMNTLEQILKSPWHEERLGALIILTQRAQQSTTPRERKTIFNFYIRNRSGINNWDLVDTSAEYCIGAYLADLDPMSQQHVLKKLLKSKSVWERRMAVVATFYFSKRRISDIVLWTVEQVMNDSHDLMHKACGWMLREFGKRASEPALIRFLQQHYRHMPRTMLRYAIERLEPDMRAGFRRGSGEVICYTQKHETSRN